MTRIDLKEIRSDYMNWIHVAQDSDQVEGPYEKIMNLLIQ
jgi:hypothetical protein